MSNNFEEPHKWEIRDSAEDDAYERVLADDKAQDDAEDDERYMTIEDLNEEYDYYTADDEHHDPWNAMEQGAYDDDPNPYHGDYSED